jgi:hypothetical protein
VTGPRDISRRGVLGGIATLPIVYGLGKAAPAGAATAGQGRTPKAPDTSLAGGNEPVRGAERRYNAPLLTPGSRLVLPAGVKAVSIQDYYRRPYLAAAESSWPRLKATDGTTVDASSVPEPGAPTRIAMLSGFAEGWYELVHASGRADRVTWDARKFPFLWLYGEFGATAEAPYHARFYTLALQPFASNPYTRTSRSD